MNKVLAINKPKNFTSFDVVAKLRNIMSLKKIGHGGTLDPIAIGVLPVFIGNATKIIDFIPDQSKKYIAGFQLGLITDTQDITGNIISKKKSKILTSDLINIIHKFVGNIDQIPPMYSAIKINGKKLYDLARQGKEVERKLRKINIYNIKLLSFDELNQSGVIETHVSKGTYIRTLINDIGDSLGVGATLISLVRTYALGLNIDKSYTLFDVEQLKKQDNLSSITISCESMLMGCPKIILNNKLIDRLINGVKIKIDCENLIYYRVYNKSGQFIGVGYNKKDDYFKLKVIS